tara:strand:+ start:1080 stop:1253 length:174 start_codon:yes stop_codon:yes gene_type:complete
MKKIVPEELYQGLRLILPVTVGGIGLMFGALKFPYPTAIIVMLVSVGFMIWSRKFFE